MTVAAGDLGSVDEEAAILRHPPAR